MSLFFLTNKAERAVDAMNYKTLSGQILGLMLLKYRDLWQSGQNKIKVSNLSEAIDEKSLHDTFSLFGNLLLVVKESPAIATLVFENSESATAAIEKVNGMILDSKQV